ncbi:MAG: hypothetical protein H6710_00620 [Myxococcales bacterium]|nr:hypothetical protein [Myxococcales bacterium]
MLRISAAADGPSACLRLENDGPAIPEAELARLFDPFVSGRAQGTGLGLAIASRIADQHGGTIEAANGGLGVAFTLRLPLREAGSKAGGGARG